MLAEKGNWSGRVRSSHDRLGAFKFVSSSWEKSVKKLRRGNRKDLTEKNGSGCDIGPWLVSVVREKSRGSIILWLLPEGECQRDLLGSKPTQNIKIKWKEYYNQVHHIDVRSQCNERGSSTSKWCKSPEKKFKEVSTNQQSPQFLIDISVFIQHFFWKFFLNLCFSIFWIV